MHPLGGIYSNLQDNAGQLCGLKLLSPEPLATQRWRENRWNFSSGWIIPLKENKRSTLKHCLHLCTRKANSAWILWKQKGWTVEDTGLQGCIKPSDLWHPRDDQRAPLCRRLPSHFGRRLCQLPNGRLCNRIQSIRETAALWATKTQILSSAIIKGTDTRYQYEQKLL